MHKDQLAFTTFTPRFDFLLTASIDGQVNFWKKRGGGQHVEFVKDFQAHTGELTAVACSMDGRNYATCGKDRTVKVWDVVNFDIFNIINVTKTPISLCWVNDLRSPYPMLAVGNEEDGEIAVFNGEVSDTDPLFTVKYVHKSPVTSMAYHRGHNCVVSTDEVGMIEYWEPTAEAKMPDKLFRLKPMDLYELVKVEYARHRSAESQANQAYRRINNAPLHLHSHRPVSASPLFPSQIAKSVYSLSRLANTSEFMTNQSLQSPTCTKREPQLSNWKMLNLENDWLSRRS